MMDTMLTIILLLMAYCCQALVCSIIHLLNYSSVPKTSFDLLKLLFLPYVIINFKNLKS